MKSKTVPAYLFYKAGPFGVRHGELVQVRLGEHGGHADDWQRRIAGQQLDAAGRHGPHLDLLERLVLGRVAGFTHVHVVGRKSLGLHFEIILRAKRKTRQQTTVSRTRRDSTKDAAMVLGGSSYLDKHDQTLAQNLTDGHLVVIVALENLLFEELARRQVEGFRRTVKPAAVEPLLPCARTRTHTPTETSHYSNVTVISRPTLH